MEESIKVDNLSAEELEAVKDLIAEPTEQQPSIKEEVKAEETEQPTEEETQPESTEEKITPTVPYKKYKEEREKRKEQEAQFAEQLGSLKEEIEKIKTDKGNVSVQQTNEDIEKLAEEYGADKEFINKLVNSITSKIKPAETINPELLEQWKSQQQDAYQEKKFAEEIDKVIKHYPEAKDFIREMKELAFDDDNLNLPLIEIFLENIKPNIVERKKTAEASRPAPKGDVIDFQSISDEEALLLPDESFQKYLSYKASKK